jgi:hypothetical protein
MKGTGFSPYVCVNNTPALAAEGRLLLQPVKPAQNADLRG